MHLKATPTPVVKNKIHLWVQTKHQIKIVQSITKVQITQYNNMETTQMMKKRAKRWHLKVLWQIEKNIRNNMKQKKIENCLKSFKNYINYEK